MLLIHLTVTYVLFLGFGIKLYCRVQNRVFILRLRFAVAEVQLSCTEIYLLITGSCLLISFQHRPVSVLYYQSLFVWIENARLKLCIPSWGKEQQLGFRYGSSRTVGKAELGSNISQGWIMESIGFYLEAPRRRRSNLCGKSDSSRKPYFVEVSFKCL